MTATNHALTGTVIGLIVSPPLLAVPLAVASHFVCDALPHFGFEDHLKESVLKTKGFRNYLMVELALCVLVVLITCWLRPDHWLLAAVCAFAAAAPDLLSYGRYVSTRAGKSWRPNAYQKFASGIQWFEKPIGATVEIAWFLAMLAICAPFFLP